jgi:hypothetical protein
MSCDSQQAAYCYHEMRDCAQHIMLQQHYLAATMLNRGCCFVLNTIALTYLSEKRLKYLG